VAGNREASKIPNDGFSAFRLFFVVFAMIVDSRRRDLTKY
jgi:hypothetical protein